MSLIKVTCISSSFIFLGEGSKLDLTLTRDAVFWSIGCDRKPYYCLCANVSRPHVN